MSSPYTPKQVANAIAVSESSVKRWCDKGLIPTHYTAGGHRRIELSGLVPFLKAKKVTLAKPELLGLPSNTGKGIRNIERALEPYLEALVSGDEEQSRRILLDLYLADHPLSEIFDRVIAPVFEKIGELWACGSAEVYQERRACEVCMTILRDSGTADGWQERRGCEITRRVIGELRSLVPQPAADAPVAIGAAPEGDQYNLATNMVELVLRDAGWNAMSLGDNIPLASMGEAIVAQQPRMFWLSCSHLVDADSFVAQYNELCEAHGNKVAFVVGGRALSEPIRQRMKHAAFCDTLTHLEALAKTLETGGSQS